MNKDTMKKRRVQSLKVWDALIISASSGQVRLEQGDHKPARLWGGETTVLQNSISQPGQAWVRPFLKSGTRTKKPDPNQAENTDLISQLIKRSVSIYKSSKQDFILCTVTSVEFCLMPVLINDKVKLVKLCCSFLELSIIKTTLNNCPWIIIVSRSLQQLLTLALLFSPILVLWENSDMCLLILQPLCRSFGTTLWLLMHCNVGNYHMHTTHHIAVWL